MAHGKKIKFSDLSRRGFLKSSSAAAMMAMPFLRSSVAMGETTTAPVRILFVALQHGWGHFNNAAKTNVSVSGTENDFQLTRGFSAFESIKEHCLFIDGFRGSFWGNAHDVSYSDIFTCAVAANESGSSQLGSHFPEPMGPSIDWVIANHLGADVLRVNAKYGSWGRTFHPLSFNDSRIVQPFYVNATQTWNALAPLFQNAQLAEAEILKLNAKNKTILDLVAKDAVALERSLPADARGKLQQYLDSMNAVGKKIIRNENGPSSNVVFPNSPAANLTDASLLETQLDLIKIAFQADTHRVAMLGINTGTTTWDWVDQSGQQRTGLDPAWSNDFHHYVAHYAEGDRQDAYQWWIKWNADKIVSFVESLRDTVDVDGRSMLHNTIIVLHGEVGDGQHDKRRNLITLIGQGGGQIRTGRYLQLPTVAPRARQGFLLASQDRQGNTVVNGVNYGDPISAHHYADLWVSLARVMGLPMNKFGFDVYNNSPLNLG